MHDYQNGHVPLTILLGMSKSRDVVFKKSVLGRDKSLAVNQRALEMVPASLQTLGLQANGRDQRP